MQPPQPIYLFHSLKIVRISGDAPQRRRERKKGRKRMKI
jgi:hypothetical protein